MLHKIYASEVLSDPCGYQTTDSMKVIIMGDYSRFLASYIGRVCQLGVEGRGGGRLNCRWGMRRRRS